jgi:nicotinate-nucleotide adenylyltransferase
VKLAILGGSFNPVHSGHLYLAETALSALAYDRVILIPAYVSPFKNGAESSSPQDRLDMLAASITASPTLALEDCEIKREGISYTIDTIDDIIRRYRPEGRPGLLLGDDLARNFANWRNAREIAEKAEIVIARRTSESKIDFPFPHRYLDNAIMEISSRRIRANIREGGPWRSLVPEGARLIIEERGLYLESKDEDEEGGSLPLRGSPQAVSRYPLNGGQAPRNAPRNNPLSSSFGESKTPVTLIARVETAARSMLNSARFIHSRGTALVAAGLALRFGLDPAAAYLAGIAHDIAKELSEEELMRLAKKDGGKLSRLEQEKPSMLHGRAAAYLVRERFGITDESVIEAIRVHTSGSPGLGDLAKIIYIADKTEPGRPRIPPELRAVENYPTLDAYFTGVLEATVAYLKSKKYKLSPGTKRLLEAMHDAGRGSAL